MADGSDGEKRSEGRERESIVRGRVRMRGREFMKSLRVRLVGGVEKREDRNIYGPFGLREREGK